MTQYVLDMLVLSEVERLTKHRFNSGELDLLRNGEEVEIKDRYGCAYYPDIPRFIYPYQLLIDLSQSSVWVQLDVVDE